jgi:hypothetical protein
MAACSWPRAVSPHTTTYSPCCRRRPGTVTNTHAHTKSRHWFLFPPNCGTHKHTRHPCKTCMVNDRQCATAGTRSRHATAAPRDGCAVVQGTRLPPIHARCPPHLSRARKKAERAAHQARISTPPACASAPGCGWYVRTKKCAACPAGVCAEARSVGRRHTPAAATGRMLAWLRGNLETREHPKHYEHTCPDPGTHTCHALDGCKHRSSTAAHAPAGSTAGAGARHTHMQCGTSTRTPTRPPKAETKCLPPSGPPTLPLPAS